MDVSLKLASSYFSMLKSLSNETKLHLIKMLIDSMLKKGEKETAAMPEKLEDFFGIWADDPEADKMSEAIRNDKCSGKTRHIVLFDE